MDKEYFSLMMNIMREGGVIARDLIKDCSPTLKPDNSVVTKADLEISALVTQKLQRLTNTSEHILIDEEDPNSGRFQNEKTLQSTPYIWALDPIDGTRNYANQLPLYGISLGLIRHGKPWMGCVYLPSLNQLFGCDGEDAFCIDQVFTPEEKKTDIHLEDMEIDHVKIFLSSDPFHRHFEWKSKDCQIIIPSCAVIDLCWPAIGRACGALLKANLWDFAGSWAIFESAGLKLRHLQTGEVLNQLDLDMFETQRPWKMKDYYLLSSERNYATLQSRLVPKQNS